MIHMNAIVLTIERYQMEDETFLEILLQMVFSSRSPWEHWILVYIKKKLETFTYVILVSNIIKHFCRNTS